MDNLLFVLVVVALGVVWILFENAPGVAAWLWRTRPGERPILRFVRRTLALVLLIPFLCLIIWWTPDFLGNAWDAGAWPRAAICILGGVMGIGIIAFLFAAPSSDKSAVSTVDDRTERPDDDREP